MMDESFKISPAKRGGKRSTGFYFYRYNASFTRQKLFFYGFNQIFYIRYFGKGLYQFVFFIVNRFVRRGPYLVKFLHHISISFCSNRYIWIFFKVIIFYKLGNG